MTKPPVRLSSAQVSLILQRAAEIDVRGDTLTVDELRRVASEAGIDPAATDKAIQTVLPDHEAGAELEESQEAPAPARRSAVPSQLWIVAGGAVGVATGFVTALEEPARPLALGGVIVYLVLRAVQGMKLGKQLDFQLQNFVLWLGAAVGSLASQAFFPEEVLVATFLAWFATSVLGGLLVQFGPREAEEEAEPPPARIGPPEE